MSALVELPSPCRPGLQERATASVQTRLISPLLFGDDLSTIGCRPPPKPPDAYRCLMTRQSAFFFVLPAILTMVFFATFDALAQERRARALILPGSSASRRRPEAPRTSASIPGPVPRASFGSEAESRPPSRDGRQRQRRRRRTPSARHGVPGRACRPVRHIQPQGTALWAGAVTDAIGSTHVTYVRSRACPSSPACCKGHFAPDGELSASPEPLVPNIAVNPEPSCHAMRPQARRSRRGEGRDHRPASLTSRGAAPRFSNRSGPGRRRGEPPRVGGGSRRRRLVAGACVTSMRTTRGAGSGERDSGRCRGARTTTS